MDELRKRLDTGVGVDEVEGDEMARDIRCDTDGTRETVPDP